MPAIKKIAYYLLSLLLFFVLSAVFISFSLPFFSDLNLTNFTDLSFKTVDLWKTVSIFFFFTVVVNIFFILKKKFRLTGVFLFVFWILILSYASSSTLSKLLENSNESDSLATQSQPNSSKRVFKDYINNSNCNESKTLDAAKKCTVLIQRSDGGHGTGFSTKQGFIVTNRHVVEGADDLKVFYNGQEVSSNLWNYSENEDLAIMRVDEDIPSCTWQNSEDLEIASTLYAVGWPYDSSGESTITKGIYSRKVLSGSTVLIQTDASINPGNSGGPLIGSCGVVGINTSKVSWSSDDRPIEGFSFAIASEYASTITNSLIQNGSVKTLPIPSNYNYEYEYVPKNEESYSYRYSEQTKKDWQNEKDTTYEMYSYWLNNTEGYNISNVQNLQHYTSKMKQAIDVIVPKINSDIQLTSSDNELVDVYIQNKQNAYNEEVKLGLYWDSNGYYHYSCEEKSCSKQSGRGVSGCSFDSDCVHNECIDGECVEVEGPGTSACLSDSWCE